MQLLLTILSLLYVLVLVAALASSLVMILRYLRRVADTLGEARTALEKVSNETEPLNHHLQQLQDATTGSAKQLAEARSKLSQIDDRLSGLVEEPGVAGATPHEPVRR